MSKQLYCYFNKIQSYTVFSESKSFFAFLLQKQYFCNRFTGRGALT